MGKLVRFLITILKPVSVLAGRMGVEIILPNDFYMARKKFELVIERPGI
jgi:hypothetical protein